jgi:hypothetical protein
MHTLLLKKLNVDHCRSPVIAAVILSFILWYAVVCGTTHCALERLILRVSEKFFLQNL